MSKETFGKTPAALYLERTLETLNNKYLSNRVGAKIHATNKTVKDIVDSYQTASMSSKTACRLLSMLRLEVTSEVGPANSNDRSDAALVDQLRRNVQIGAIKHALVYIAGHGTNLKNCVKQAHRHAAKFGSQFVSETRVMKMRGEFPTTDSTAELLKVRSDRRCLRQGKPHMKGGV